MSKPGTFELLAVDAATGARYGRLWTRHGVIETPVFMPVGTQATVKTMAPWELDEVGASVILANTYHLGIRPGAALIEARGGLHRFMAWDRPILTDSGGYQVFSLAQRRVVTDEGVAFQSHLDGAPVFLGPREVMAIQRSLGSDIAMVLDECPPFPCSRDYACSAVAKTLRWATICSEQARAEGQLVFGIVQGGPYPELREQCARALAPMGFDGYAIGGVSVGEPEAVLLRGMRDSVAHLPTDRPRYLMGVGRLNQIVEAVADGVDMFDCVMPTRFARNGTAFTGTGRFPLKAARYKEDERPIEPGCDCRVCGMFSRAYIRHLLHAGEILGLRLLTWHNLHRYLEFMRELRTSIREGTFGEFRARHAEMYSYALREACDETDGEGDRV